MNAFSTPGADGIPAVGFLLDVDGPIASPVTRTINIPSITHDLVALAAAGIPIAFITGRSDAFIRDVVIATLLDNGLGEALRKPGARMFGVFEKGGSWADIGPDGMGEVTVDRSVAFTDDAVDAIRQLTERDYAETMFFDETKRAMISVEQRTDVVSSEYLAAQRDFQDAAFDVLTGRGIGLRYGDREVSDAEGAVPYRVDPTIISTDIESVLLDKDRGAERALDSFSARGPLAREWRTVGDSRSDYKMADYLHAQGHAVVHVDVRPSDGILEKNYEVQVMGDEIHDDAGAQLLSEWRERLGL